MIRFYIYTGFKQKTVCMELLLKRTYSVLGVAGVIAYHFQPIAFSIELPWNDNRTGVSCIPEGRYELKKRFSLRFGWHLLVTNVPGRALILIHPANDALRELKGCIGVVSSLTGPGTGTQSRAALKRLTGLAFAALARKEAVFLTIHSDSYGPRSTTVINKPSV